MAIRALWRALFGKGVQRKEPAEPAPSPSPESSGHPSPPAANEAAARPSGPPDVLEQARAAFMDGRPQDADQIARNALAELEETPPPDDAPELARRRRAALLSALLAVRGGVAARTERLDAAGDYFRESLERARESHGSAPLGAALLNLLDVRTRQGQRSAAEPMFDEAVAVTKDTPFEDVLAKLLIERGLAALAAGELPDATALFDRAITVRPAWPFPWYQRAWTRFLAGDASGALEDYRECARRRRPFFTVQREIRCLEDVAAGRVPVEAYRSYCVIRERVRTQPAASEEAAGRLIERHPDFAPAYLLRAEARLALGDPLAAGEAARQTLEHDPDPDTAAAALFLEWNLARARSEEDALHAIEERLLEAYRDSPAAALVQRLREVGRRDVMLRWTWALDGTFRLEEGAVPKPPGEGPASTP